MKTSRRCIDLVLVLALASCATVPKPPQVVTVQRDRFVPIPAELDAPCPVPALQGRTWGSLADLVVNLRGALTACSDRMAAIRAVQGTSVK